MDGDGGLWWFVGGLEEVPDAAGEVAFEAAQRFAAGFAFGLFAGEVGGGFGVEAAFADGEAVQGAVELAVAAAVEAVADRVRPEEAGIGADPAIRASFASVAKRSTPAISPTSFAAISTPQPRSASSRGATWATRQREFALERVDRLGQLADAAQLVARDPHPGGLLGAREAASEPLRASARRSGRGSGSRARARGRAGPSAGR